MQQMVAVAQVKRAQNELKRASMENELLEVERSVELLRSELKVRRLEQQRAQHRHFAVQMQVQQIQRWYTCTTYLQSWFSWAC